MSDIEILKYRQKGYCCSQILVLLFLDLMGKENWQLVEFAKGLCIGGGMKEGLCGILQCGISVLSMYSYDNKEKFQEMSEEFKKEFMEISEKKVSCGDIIGESFPEPDLNICGSLLKNSYELIGSILVKNEIDPGESPEYGI